MSAPAQNKIKSAATMLALAGVLVAILGMAYLFLTPKSYRATARIKVEKSNWINHQAIRDAQNSSDSHLASAECQVLRSNAFLDRVVQNLDLSHEWGKRYRQGTPLSQDDAREMLRSKSDIHSMPDSSIIVISVTSEESEETAKIANELARLYTNYCQSQRQDTIHGKVDSLQHQWEVQNKKVQDTQLKLQQIKLEIKRDRVRATNGPIFYDSDNYGLLQNKRIELESQTVQLRDQLNELKMLQPAEQRQVLSSLDTETNSVLNTSLAQLRKAKTDLADAESDHGADSPEVKHAQKIVDEMEKSLTRTVSGIIMMKQADLAADEAAFKALDDELKNIKAPNQVDTNILQNPAFAQTYQELQQLEHDRDALQDQMNSTYTKEAFQPVVITAELTDSAETPSRPFMPDSRVALGGIGGGGALSLAGLGLLLLIQMRKSALRKS
ncbi:MAG TPA: Wzz/FepE/Etk N-terminal domain-containing protein [Verrucomicrobiae bacterium]|nr:Wzz/FepE/Etk N-terminal domain-containing protein [Verrucomicrobiae bacterium]